MPRDTIPNTRILFDKWGPLQLVVTSEERKTSNAFQFESESVIIPLVSSTGHGHASIKRIHFQKGKFALGSILCAVTPKDTNTLSAKYLYLFLDLNKDKELVSRMKGMANVTLSIKEIAKIEIPVPSIQMQEKIVRSLDNQLAKAAEIKQMYNESLKISHKLFSSVLSKIFLNGIGNKWEEKTVNEISKNIQYGYTASAKKNGNAKLLRITDIQDGKVDWNTVPFCDCNNLEKYKLYSGDIMFARTGATVGKSFLITNPSPNVIFASYLIRLQIKENVLPEYIYYFFQSSLYWDQISDRKAGAAQPNVNGTKLKKLKVPVPSVKEQKEIIDRLDSISKKIDIFIQHQYYGYSLLEKLGPSFFREAFLNKD